MARALTTRGWASGWHIMIWQIDRLFRAGPLCALATFLLPLGMAVLVNSQRGVDNVLGIVLVAAGIIFIGSVIGSVLTSGLGAVLFGLGAIVAEVPIVVLALVGGGLYVTLVLHDLAGVLHRGPRINPTIWWNTTITTAAVVALGAAIFSITYIVGGLATWQSIVVPFAIAAIGFAAKLAADAHRTAARQLTRRRKREPEQSAIGNDDTS